MVKFIYSGKAISTGKENRPVAARGWKKEERLTTKSHKVTFWDDGNVSSLFWLQKWLHNCMCFVKIQIL